MNDGIPPALAGLVATIILRQLDHVRLQHGSQVCIGLCDFIQESLEDDGSLWSDHPCNRLPRFPYSLKVGFRALTGSFTSTDHTAQQRKHLHWKY